MGAEPYQIIDYQYYFDSKTNYCKFINTKSE
jgi:hypothetical protein